MSSEFFSVLETMNSGKTLSRIEAQFEELRAAIVDTEGSGELILKLKISSGKKNLNKVTATVTTKVPQEAPETAVFYFDDNKRLVRDDPRQMKLPGMGKVVPLRREEVPLAAEAHNA